MVCEYAFRGAEIFSSGMCALKVYKQNVVAAIIRIDVLGGPRATPIFERGNFQRKHGNIILKLLQASGGSIPMFFEARNRLKSSIL